MTRTSLRRSSTLAALVCVSALLSACGGANLPGSASAGSAGAGSCTPTTATVPVAAVKPITTAPRPQLPVTVNSADGRKVTVTDTSRVLAVNLYGSLAELVYNLGEGAKLVGRDTSTTLPEAAQLPLVTHSGHDLSTEAVLALEPTLVIADDTIGPPEVLTQLRKSGVPVVMIDSEQDLDHIGLHIRQVAAALGVKGDGDRLASRVQKQITAARNEIPETGKPLTIAFLYLRGNAGVYLIGGKGAGSDAMIESIGAVDAGTKLGLEDFRPLNSEGLIRVAPDVILVMTDGLKSVGGINGLLKMPGVAQTPAGETHRVVDMDDGTLLNFGADTGRAIQALAEAVADSCPTASSPAAGS